MLAPVAPAAVGPEAASTCTGWASGKLSGFTRSYRCSMFETTLSFQNVGLHPSHSLACNNQGYMTKWVLQQLDDGVSGIAAFALERAEPGHLSNNLNYTRTPSEHWSQHRNPRNRYHRSAFAYMFGQVQGAGDPKPVPKSTGANHGHHHDAQTLQKCAGRRHTCTRRQPAEIQTVSDLAQTPVPLE